VLLDLSDVREIDSRGVGLIVDLNRRCRERGFAFRARGLTPHVQRIFDLFQLGRLFPVEPQPSPTAAPHA
jgi:anti-anti-sigma factor